MTHFLIFFFNSWFFFQRTCHWRCYVSKTCPTSAETTRVMNIYGCCDWMNFLFVYPVIRNQKYMCMGTFILLSNYFYPRFHAVLEILLGAQRFNAFFNLQNTVFLFKLKDDTMKMWYTCILIIYMHLFFYMIVILFDFFMFINITYDMQIAFWNKLFQSSTAFLYNFIKIQPRYQVLKLTFIQIKTLKLPYVTLYIKIVGFNLLYQMNYTCI